MSGGKFSIEITFFTKRTWIQNEKNIFSILKTKFLDLIAV